jgi:hypothetical protein
MFLLKKNWPPSRRSYVPMLDHAFHFKPSKHYLTLMSVVLFASLIIVLCLPLAGWIKGLSFLLIAVYGGHILWQFGFLRSKQSIVSIRRDSEGRWLLCTNNNVQVAELSGDSTVTGWVSVLRFYVHKRLSPKSCIVFRDSLPHDQYRKLLVVLRMYSPG